MASNHQYLQVSMPLCNPLSRGWVEPSNYFARIEHNKGDGMSLGDYVTEN